MRVFPDELMTYGDRHEFLYIPRSVELAWYRTVGQALRSGQSVPGHVEQERLALRKQLLAAGHVKSDLQIKHKPGGVDHDQTSHGSWSRNFGSFRHRLPVSKRVWQGKRVEGSPSMSKLKTGVVGERVAARAMEEITGYEFAVIGQGVNNSPLDLAGDHIAVEVKAGHATNSYTAQHWRATIGQPSPLERSLMDLMDRNAKRDYNHTKQMLILKRKYQQLKEMSEELGSSVAPLTLGVIFNSEGTQADIFMVTGFHSRLSWKMYAIDRYYVGTYQVEAFKMGGHVIPVKHYPQAHDQDSHGNWATGGTKPALPRFGETSDELKLLRGDIYPQDDFAYQKGFTYSFVAKDEAGKLLLVKPDRIPYREGVRDEDMYTTYKAFSAADAMAFEMSDRLGLNIVPPSAINDDPLRHKDDVPEDEKKNYIASVARWVEGETAADLKNAAKDGKLPENTNPEQYKAMVLMDVVFGNWDRHLNNWLVQDDGQIVAIDNSDMFNNLIFSTERDISTMLVTRTKLWKEWTGTSLTFSSDDLAPFQRIRTNPEFKKLFQGHFGSTDNYDYEVVLDRLDLLERVRKYSDAFAEREGQ